MKKTILRTLSYILVAIAAATVALTLENGFAGAQQNLSKLDQLGDLIEARFIEDTDRTAMEDAAADAMVRSLGDRWSYYIPAEDYAEYQQQMNNAYVGVGITISLREDENGFDIIKVNEGGPAEEAGLLAGDVLIKVNGENVAQSGMDGTKALVQGEEGTTVDITVLRDGKERTFTVTRKHVQITVAKGRLLDGNIGLISIYNFDARCADETLSAIEELLEQGAQALIFDVRFNPGGYKDELVHILDYLLPEGPLFRSEDYAGHEEVDYSNEAHLDIPMAVLVNGESYSAAEFFAAALSEYDAAVVVGQQTCGKGYFQNTFRLDDGSAVGLSTGKYFTPDGVCLASVGITPDVVVEVDDKTAAMIYSGQLDSMEDPQILAAIEALKS